MNQSKLFCFDGRPSYLEAIDDCLNRPAFIVLEWIFHHGEDSWYPTGWYHWDSIIVESDRITLYAEVTSTGGSPAESIPLSESDSDRLYGQTNPSNRGVNFPNSPSELCLAVLQLIAVGNPARNEVRGEGGKLVTPFCLESYVEKNANFEPKHADFSTKLDELGCYSSEEL